MLNVPILHTKLHLTSWPPILDESACPPGRARLLREPDSSIHRAAALSGVYRRHITNLTVKLVEPEQSKEKICQLVLIAYHYFSNCFVNRLLGTIKCTRLANIAGSLEPKFVWFVNHGLMFKAAHNRTPYSFATQASKLGLLVRKSSNSFSRRLRY